MNVEIRRAIPNDAEGIVAVLNPIIAARVYSAFDTPFTAAVEREYIRALPARGLLHVAVRPGDDDILGFQTMEPFAAYTHAFDHVGVIGTFVDLRYRRQGIASQLFQATLAEAVRMGYEKLFTFVRADNPAALQTYRRQGFRTVGTALRQVKVDGRYVDEVIIEKLLPVGSVHT
jgi:L-amino acid N-acyltransferase YncA